MEKTNQIEKTQMPISLMYATVKKEMTMAVRDVIQKHPLPLYMVHSILESITTDLKNEMYLELTDEVQKYDLNLQQYYIDCKEQLIKDFENKEG